MSYDWDWPDVPDYRRIEYYVRYAISLLSPKQALRAFQEITGLKYVPSDIRIRVSPPFLVLDHVLRHGCLILARFSVQDPEVPR